MPPAGGKSQANGGKASTGGLASKGGLIKSSIVYKLNLGIFARLFWIFITLDLLLFIGAGTAVLSYGLRTAASAQSAIEQNGLPEDEGWLNISGCYIVLDEKLPGSFRLPSLLFPLDSIKGTGYLNFPSETGESLWARLDSLTYLLSPGGGYYITIGLGAFIKPWKYIFPALWCLQLLMLINGLFSGARMIRNQLRPISELAEAARSLNKLESGIFSPKDMEALAGKINRISEANLDNRIAVDSTQTELRNLAASINSMLDRINESYRAQVRFVSDASHELRTPISVLQGYANLLDRWGKNDPKVLQESIDAIKEEAANMKSLVEQLLFLARGDSNNTTLHIDEFDVSELVGEVFKETQMIDPGHRFEASLQPASISADETLIKQAVRILVDNAIKYTPSGGLIRISVSENDGHAAIMVADEGMGITPEAIPLIFDRFYRAEQSRARATGGAGLGLSIAKWIAERHGGHMEVLSREGIGTRISIIIPSKKATAFPHTLPVNIN